MSEGSPYADPADPADPADQVGPAVRARTPRRLLLVHAHPDDETLGNGATMARYAAEGHEVTLVTCTRGEEGLVLVPELAHLAADRDDRLGEHREGELARAMAALGVRDHRFLDTLQLPGAAAVHYRDSGMAWDEQRRAVAAPQTGPEAFARADVDEAAARVAVLIRTLRPHALVTYEPGGGYGHPDHVQAHRVAMRAAELAAGPGPGGEAWSVPKVYWNALPERLVRAAFADLGEPGESGGPGAGRAMPSMVVPDEVVTTRVDAEAWTDRKKAALRAHATQVLLVGDAVQVGDGPPIPVVGTEFYRLVAGSPAGPRGADGRELDLFAGLEAVD